jgi:hypothetical protein
LVWNVVAVDITENVTAYDVSNIVAAVVLDVLISVPAPEFVWNVVSMFVPAVVTVSRDVVLDVSWRVPAPLLVWNDVL